MQSLGQSALKFAQSVPVTTPKKVRSANYAKLKQDWQNQVACDRTLPWTSHRIALLWQTWLNSRTLTAWPAQSTIAELLHVTPRAVREGMKALEDRGHLQCISQFRGGRMSNRYRIILDGAVITGEDGTDVPVTPERVFRAEGKAPSPVRGASVPGRAVGDCRRTPERTPERTIEADRHMETGVPVTADRAKGIMAEVYVEERVNGGGYVQG
jgi:hypothetical protein